MSSAKYSTSTRDRKSKFDAPKIGIIGHRLLDDGGLIEDRVEKVVGTPFGSPSSKLIMGHISGVETVLVMRNGEGNNVSSQYVNYRANIAALKAENCQVVIGIHSCLSLNDEVFKPGDVAIPDQFIDMTQGRRSTFYDQKPDSPPGNLFLSMFSPFCVLTRQLLFSGVKEYISSNPENKAHDRGSMLVVDGVRSMTRAEMKMYRSWGADLSCSTLQPECTLAREAALPYGAMAFVANVEVQIHKLNKEESNSLRGTPVADMLTVPNSLPNSSLGYKRLSMMISSDKSGPLLKMGSRNRVVEIVQTVVALLATKSWRERVHLCAEDVKSSMQCPGFTLISDFMRSPNSETTAHSESILDRFFEKFK